MTLISINPYDITLTATSINVEIYEFQFGSHIQLKLSFFDANGVFLLYKLLKIEGQDYTDMTTSGNSDAYIKNYVETQLSMTIIL
jgi:hypothetical protein